MTMSLEDVRIESLRYGPIAYIATVSPQGEPHLAPVAVSWFEGNLYAFVLSSSMKVRNARLNPRATVHFSVGPTTNWDSCIVWGEVFLLETTAERQKLWDQMGYDLAAFEPGGPESDNHLFFQIKPSRATVLRAYGMAGRDTWKNTAEVQS
jgi:nitroimidazol reductase NimA-like FMN-containing flavoprotein (pyridoxamine 5'-phosphate oxidase superfamily)